MHEPPSLHFLSMDLDWDPGLQTDAMYVGMRSGRSFGPLAKETISAGARLTTHDSAQKSSGITTVRQPHKNNLARTRGAPFPSFLAAPVLFLVPAYQLKVLMVAACLDICSAAVRTSSISGLRGLKTELNYAGQSQG